MTSEAIKNKFWESRCKQGLCTIHGNFIIESHLWNYNISFYIIAITKFLSRLYILANQMYFGFSICFFIQSWCHKCGCVCVSVIIIILIASHSERELLRLNKRVIFVENRNMWNFNSSRKIGSNLTIWSEECTKMQTIHSKIFILYN